MKINSKTIVISILVILFCGIFVSSSLGLWKTESTKTPQKISQGEFEGQYDPEDIRGSYSFQDIENAFGVKAEVTARAFNLDAENPGTIKAKDMESVYAYLDDDIEIGTGSIKMFVSMYTGLPYAQVEYLPSTAVELLKEEGKWSPEMDQTLAAYIIDVGHEVSAVEASEEDGQNDSASSDDHDEGMEVEGKTTFADVIEWGLEKEDIEDVVGFEIENININIRDACEANGVSFSEAKGWINDMLE